MSLEEVQDLCHILASLNFDGQHTIVSPESFAKPNFNLVCHILQWMAAILEKKPIPGKGPQMTGQPESERIAFLVQMGNLFKSNLGVQVNLINLYRADWKSCRELLKVASFIYQSAKVAVQTRPETNARLIDEMERRGTEEVGHLRNLIGGCHFESVSVLDSLASELETLLQDELAKFHGNRSSVMDRKLDLRELDRVLAGAQAGIVEKTRELAEANENLEEDMRRLDKRLELKDAELGTARQKVDDLLIQSPAYYDKYEKLHRTYEKQYVAYVSKYQNLVYLKSCVYGTNDLAPQEASINFEPETSTESRVGRGFDLANERNISDAELEAATRPTTAARETGLELEGLLNEFVADSATAKTNDEDAAAADDSTLEDEEESEEDEDDDDDSLTVDF